MSQSSNSTKHSSNSSMKTHVVVPKAHEIQADHLPKRAIPDQQKDEAKKIKTEHQSVSESSTESKLITGTEVAPLRAAKGILPTHEIPDEELLQMALEFEKKYPY